MKGPNDAFVTKLAPDGNGLDYSTYLGGTGADSGSGIAVDSTGAAYITGQVSSTDFPTTTGAYQDINKGSDDAFVTKLAPNGNGLVYSTYLGGASSDRATGIAIDTTGAAYVTGGTESSDFPTTRSAHQRTTNTEGGSDAFMTKLAPNGHSLAYSTDLGGSGTDYGEGIAVDRTGATYITGATTSTDFPTTRSAYRTTRLTNDFDAFVAKFTGNFDLSDIQTHRNGTITFSVKVPARGAVDVMVTAWNDNLATIALLQPAAHRFIFARWHTTARTAGTITARVRPNARGRLLVTRRTYSVTLRLWATYTPPAGPPTSVGVYGLHLPKR